MATKMVKSVDFYRNSIFNRSKVITRCILF